MTTTKPQLESVPSVPEPSGASSRGPDSGEETEDESEVLEESPCGRWQKRREEVKQRNVPGIDSAFLAMDTEEGVEVVWNEVRISERKSSKSQLDKIKQVFDNLIQLEHPNIVKFHRYWMDTKSDKPRVIFITEYMSAGSLKVFLKKTKDHNKTFKAWKRWSTQILSALSYLHSCHPKIIHGNLNCDTIFIQSNGLIKIGSVAPDAIYSNVKSYKQEARNMHYIAPEYGCLSEMTPAVDIYSFGICALEMAVLEIPGNGDTSNHVSQECIEKALLMVDDFQQKHFISQCLEKDPELRLRARELLFHPALFEVHSLKLLAAHSIVKKSSHGQELTHYPDKPDPNQVIAEVFHADRNGIQILGSQVPTFEIDKFLEDVRTGVYPLTAFALSHPSNVRARAISPEVAEAIKSETPEPTDSEQRCALTVNVQVMKLEDRQSFQMSILLRMDDKMNRQLMCEINKDDTADILVDELIHYGFVSKRDRENIHSAICEGLKQRDAAFVHPTAPYILSQAASS